MSHTYHNIENTSENIFKILDQVLETGTPATVHTIVIQAADQS